MAHLSTAKGDLSLNCYPKVSSSIQQPWDAADIYLIEQAELGLSPAIINDQWGALSVFACQQGRSSYSWSDSYCSMQAIRQNLAKLPTDLVDANILNAEHDIKLDNGLLTFPSTTDSLWIQCPKSFDQLHWWLLLALEQLGPGIKVSLAGMAKHIPVKWLKWLEQHNQNYQQHPIRKKARLIQFEISDQLPPLKYEKSYIGPDQSPISALPGVFSRDHMDIGSRFFISHLSQQPLLKGKVVDLGCGNGLLSIACLQLNPDKGIELLLCDDSSLALKAAKGNIESRGNFNAHYYHTDALLNVPGPVDTILCNPPFHTGNRISTAAAERMFKQGRKILNPQGQLLVVANRHLGYKPLLKKDFANITTLASDSKFVIYRCTNPK